MTNRKPLYFASIESQYIEAVYLVFQRRGRDRLRIVAEILSIAHNGSLKTQIMYRANLSFVQVNDYLSMLLDCKLLEIDKTTGKSIYKTTPKGERFVQAFREIRDLLIESPIEDKEAVEVKVMKK